MALTDILSAALPAVGTILGGPVGGAIGSFAGGLVQNAAAGNKMKEWDKLDKQIPLNDPEQQRYLGRVEQQERQYRGMTDPTSALASRLAQQSGAQTQSNLLRAGAGIQGMLSSQNITQRNLAGIGATASTQADNLLDSQGQLINMMAQRRYDRQRYRRDIAMAQGAQHQQDANNQMMASIGLLPSLAGGMGGEGGFRGLLGGMRKQPSQTAGVMGGEWRTMGTGGPVPPSPTQAPQYPLYSRVSGQYPQAPTSAYDMGQQVNI